MFETLNSAWGLALDNLYFLIDWNDFGIDDHPVSAAMPGTPADWFGGHGWRVVGTEQGMDWAPVTETLLALTGGENPDRRPSAAWFKTRKGRGYLKYDQPGPRRAAQNELRDLLGDQAAVRRAIRRAVRQLR